MYIVYNAVQLILGSCFSFHCSLSLSLHGSRFLWNRRNNLASSNHEEEEKNKRIVTQIESFR